MNARTAALLDLAAGKIDALPVEPFVPFSARVVPPSGPLTAKVAVIGEAPGADEAEALQPFIGRSGKKLRAWIRHAGLQPEACYLDNVYPSYPERGKISTVLPEVLEASRHALFTRLEALSCVRVLVPTGNIALRALLGFEGITKHRGSMYPLTLGGRQVTVIPCIHPAAVLRGQTQWERRGYLDWLRIAEEAETEELRLPQRQHIINPTRRDIEELFDAMAQGALCAIDIETAKKEGRILCVGFSVESHTGVVFPWTDTYRDVIARLCAHPIDKALHNHLYDLWYLTRAGVHMAGRIWDTMHMLHALMPTDNVGLAYATSIMTREPYYKDESKDEDDPKLQADLQTLMSYCSKDVCVTREIAQKVWADLSAANMLGFYERHYEALHAPMLDVMLQGVRVDHARRTQVLNELLLEARTARDELELFNDDQPLYTLSTRRDKAVWQALATDGLAHADQLPYTPEQIHRSLNTINAKTVSSTKLKGLLYGKYQLPVQTKRRESGDETETADIFTLRKLRYEQRDNAEVAAVIDLVIQHVRAQKLASFITDNKFDEDGRMRFSLKVTTETGRLASSASPRGRKVNSQNIPRDPRVRSLFLPEPGHVCLAVDGSSAEARVCFARTRAPELIAMARNRFHDQHRQTAIIVGMAPSFDETPENFQAITPQQRQVAKSVSHGAQRSMQGHRLSQTLLKDDMRNQEGQLFTEEYCDEAIERYHRRFPAIRAWHRRVKEQLRKTRCLENSWGRTWPVPYFELTDELYRKAISWFLQSEIAEWLNVLGFAAIYQFFLRNRMTSRVMFQEHDGLVLSCALDEVYDSAVYLRDSLEVEREYDGVHLTIPCEFTLSPWWGKGREFKELPDRATFETAAKEMILQGTAR